MKPKGLLVMADTTNSQIIKAFTGGSYYLVQEETLGGAIERLRRENFDMVLIDLDGLRADERATVRSVATTWPDLRLFIMTSNEGWANKIKNAMDVFTGIIDVPFNISEVVEKLCAA
jgi:DNA-binding response OmpR family regulator